MKWLGFAINGNTYRFRCPPFGLSTAPRTFTRVVKVIAEQRRRSNQLYPQQPPSKAVKAPQASSWMRMPGLIAMLQQSLLRMRKIQLHVLGPFRSHRESMSRRIHRPAKLIPALNWWTQPPNIHPGTSFTTQQESSTLTSVTARMPPKRISARTS